MLGPDFGCAIPATAASSVLTEDAIYEGQVPLFTGAYRFKTLFCITIPCLIVFYLFCIYWSCKQNKIFVEGEWVKQDSALSQFLRYFQLQDMDDRFMRQSCKLSSPLRLFLFFFPLPFPSLSDLSDLSARLQMSNRLKAHYLSQRL